MSIKIKQLENVARNLRHDTTEMLYRAGSGHWGGSLGMADIFAALFFGGIIYYPWKKNQWNRRDRFILSCGHICPIFYATLDRLGFFGDKKAILRKLGSPLQGHPSHIHIEAVETSTGPLGQGVGVAVGKALALKMQKKKQRVFCVTSDGEHEEGSTWEAISSAAKFKLDNLIFILDRNHLQIGGSTEEVANLGNLAERYRFLGWDVFQTNGHIMPEILDTFRKVKRANGRPKLVIAETTMGKGVSFVENDYRYHGRAPNEEEYKKAVTELRK
ncbi:transketolase [Candidatus Microgenomates bacterium]|nr:transketolase [Candidatus Microgenomates bacterium]